MLLLNLSLAELLALLGAVSAFVLALYLLDRSRSRQVVATLRFWVQAESPAPLRRKRRKIQQPLSLVLQLLSLALLLLAIAQLRFGGREGAPRDHVLILDTSSWMEARTPKGPLMEEARLLARRWLALLPPNDRVLLIRADALATPATVFESNHKLVEDAIARSRAGQTALDVDKALELAVKVQKMHASHAGEIVFVGSGRISSSEAGAVREAPPNLRFLPVEGEIANCGLRTIGLRRSVADPSLWEVFISVKNHGAAPREVSLGVQFGGGPLGVRRLKLPAGGEQNETFDLRTRAAGWLEARLFPGDGFPADDRAVLELPQQKVLRVTVYSEQSEWLRPVLAANPHVVAEYRRPSDYGGASAAAVVILDRFNPPRLPTVDSLWIEPPLENLAVKVASRVSDVPLARWRSEFPLAAGLRTADLRLQSTEVFAPQANDIPIAETVQGPVILARPGKPKIVVFGFHPMRSAMRYELATPLLFANILRWMAPQIFRRWELNAGSVGSVKATLDPDTDLSQLRVLAENGAPLPFTVRDRVVRLFSGVPGTVRVIAGDREQVYSLTLPEVADAKWLPPPSVKRGLGGVRRAGVASKDLWQLLALLAGLGLLVDWLLFGQRKSASPVVGRPLWNAPNPLVRLWRSWRSAAGLARRPS